MDLPTETLTILVYVSLALNVLLLALVAVLNVRRGPQPDRQGPPLDEVLRASVERHGRALRRLDGAVKQLAAQDRSLSARVEGAVQLVGLVRYDAFAEMGGRLSFSCALLDERGDGVVVTSINGRQDTRVYAKPVEGGRSSHNLSDEEEQAIERALGGERGAREAVRAR